MAKIISKVSIESIKRTGRFSDGSDEVATPLTVWDVRVVDDDDQERTLRFDHDPSSQEILDSLPEGTDLTPTRKAHLERFLTQPYADWQRWKATRIEATPRGAAVPVINALTVREEQAWTLYLAAIQQWRTAT